jgi:hypothetical protein
MATIPIIGAELFAATNAPITATLVAKATGLFGVVSLWWNAGDWELAGALPLLGLGLEVKDPVGTSVFFTPNKIGTPAPFPVGTPLIFDYLVLKPDSVFDSIQTGTSNPIKLYTPPRVGEGHLPVNEAALAAVVFGSGNTAKIGFPARIGDVLSENLNSYPICIEVTNVSPSRTHADATKI